MKSINTKLACAALFSALAFGGAAWAQIGSVSNSVYMEEMTWMEINDRLKAGTSIALVPTGGVQQAGPHLVTGAHMEVMRYTAGEIARRLGGALTTPVIPFVPAGRVNPPEGNMRFAGTFSLADSTYAAVLEDVARSLKQHGFRMICFLGEDAGAQNVMAQVASKLGREWITDGVRVVHVTGYYAGQGQDEWTDTMPQRIGNATAPGGHIETSELLAVDAASVRANMLAARTDRDFKLTGATGDTTLATAALGRKYLSLKIEAAVRQIQNASSNAKR
ncbi:MAG: creatininase family protein [Rickettsiales bacterium]|nr:creatininase family protein [Rickettsiales bacterium]